MFPGARLDRPTRDGLAVVLTATDLASGSAVRFGSERSSCSRFGRITDPVTIGTAVAASAAYPILLPTMDRTFRFEQRDGRSVDQRVSLTDGGVLDNLGLSVLQPGRSPGHTGHVYDVTHILSCDAGRGPLAHRIPSNWIMRNARAFTVVHTQAQNQARGRLHEWQSAGSIDGFVMAYLGQRDRLLPRPVADLVPNERTASYGTNFAAMRADDLAAISTRGEQLMRALLPYYCPELLR